jgi:5-methylcytosine-specific restriction endonuclease McrA
MAQHYRCSGCNAEFTSKDVQIDHIRPVVDPTTGFTTWDEFIERLFCPKDNLQVLCKTCHDTKTQSEKTTRNSTKESLTLTSAKQSKRQKAPSNLKANSRKKK